MSDATQDRPMRLASAASLVGTGPEELHVLLPNHTVTFLEAPVVTLVREYARALAVPATRAQATVAAQAATGVDGDLCRYVWDLLEQSGCLVPAASPRASTSPLVEFWASEGWEPSAVEARLAAAPVVLVAPSAVSAQVLDAVTACGLSARPVDADGAADDVVGRVEERMDEGTGLVAVWGVGYGTALARSLNAATLARRLPALWGFVSGVVARLGPMVLPGGGACLECLNLRMLSHGSTTDHRVLQALRRSPDGVQPIGPVHPAFAAATAALFATEAANIVLKTPPRTLGTVFELVHGDPEARRRSVRRVPTCPACHPAVPPRFAWDARGHSAVLTEAGT